MNGPHFTFLKTTEHMCRRMLSLLSVHITCTVYELIVMAGVGDDDGATVDSCQLGYLNFPGHIPLAHILD